MLHGWRFRMPLWLAVAIVAGIYLVRSILRGYDFRLDIPADLVALALFAAVLGMVAYVRHAFGEPGDETVEAAPSDEHTIDE